VVGDFFINVDSWVIRLTAWKTVDFWRKEIRTPLIRLIWRDGLIYFTAIFSMNLVNVIIFSQAPIAIRPINVEPSVMLTVMMSCRIVLNLRDMSSHTGNWASNKAGSEVPYGFPPVIRGAAHNSPQSKENNNAPFPIDVVIHGN